MGKLGDREGPENYCAMVVQLNFALSNLGKIRKEFVFLGKEWCARGDSISHSSGKIWQSRPSGYEPEGREFERIQQVGTNPRKPFSPSFVAICFTFAHLPLFSAICVTLS